MTLSLGKRTEAEEHWKKALALLDRMTEREKYRTLGLYYMTFSANYEKAIENYDALVKAYPSDFAAHNNLAIAYFSVLKFPEALEEQRQVVALYPKNVIGRTNYALFAMYAGQFETAAQQAGELVKSAPSFYQNYLPLAVAAIMNGDYEAARRAYGGMRAAGPAASSLALMGLADLELYLGRYKEAETLLGTGIAEDRTSGNASSLAIKRVALAEAYQGSGRNPSALPILAEVSRQSREPAVVVPVARMLARAGHLEDADKLAGELDGRLQPQLRAYAKIIDGVIALTKGRRASAIDGFRDSVKLTDFWLARVQDGDHLCAGRVLRGGAHRARGVRKTARRSDGIVSRRHSDGAISGNASLLAGTRARRPRTGRGGAIRIQEIHRAPPAIAVRSAVARRAQTRGIVGDRRGQGDFPSCPRFAL